MRSSIRVRWVLVTLAIVLATVGITAVLAAEQAATNTQESFEEVLEERDFVFEQLLSYRQIANGWEGAQPMVDRLAEITHSRIALTDDNGRILADSSDDENSSLPSLPLGFLDPAAAPFEIVDSFDLDPLDTIQPFLRCLDDRDVDYVLEQEFEFVSVPGTAPAYDCLVSDLDLVVSAGGPNVVQIIPSLDNDLVDELVECFLRNDIPFVFEAEPFGAFPVPVEVDDDVVERAVISCFDSFEALEDSTIFEVGDGVVVYMDVDGADPFEVGADPFDPAVFLTIAVIAVVAAGAAWFAASRLVRPIETLTEAVTDMGRGDLERRVGFVRTDEIGDLGRAFDDMADEILENDRQRRRMTSDIAHELRTPLANIRGYLEGAQDGVIDLDGQLVDTVHEEAVHLQQLVDDLQTLSLVESGRLRLDVELIDLASLTRSVAAAHMARAADADIDLEVSAPETVEASADAGRTRQVVTNLLENALRYTPRGGRVALVVSAAGDRVEIAVEDTGVGMAPDDLEHAFDRFYRADAARGRAEGGSGLGLAISRELCRAMDGDLRATSELGRGSRFVIDLPAG